MLEDETPAETALVRRGEAAAVARINHLKSVVASHERNVDLLTTTLSAQNSMLSDVGTRVAALAKALPQSPNELSEQGDTPQWEAVLAAVHQLQQRIQKGAMPSSTQRGSPASGACSSARNARSPAAAIS